MLKVQVRAAADNELRTLLKTIGRHPDLGARRPAQRARPCRRTGRTWTSYGTGKPASYPRVHDQRAAKSLVTVCVHRCAGRVKLALLSRCQRSTKRAMSSPGYRLPTRACITETQAPSGGPGAT